MEKKTLNFDIDDILEKLIEGKQSTKVRTTILTEQEIKAICLKSKDIFLSQPMLLELVAPIKICGKKKTRLF